jgi:hypothetical protein
MQAGLIVPRENHLALSIAEKLEDLATVVFLPLVSLSLILMRRSAHNKRVVLYAIRPVNQ